MGNSIAFNKGENDDDDGAPDLSINSEMEVRRADFANDFVFGCSTSAYQIEGGAGEGGRNHSIWDDFTNDTPEKIKDGKNGDVAANHYTMYKDDVKLMRKTGLDAYRFSISWSRILPGGRLSAGINREGIKFYSDLIDTILAEGMKPYVTLFHWDLPLALQQKYCGFLDKKIVKDFRDFAELCFWEFGDRVKHWITINEAWTYTVKGYCWGAFPPGRGSLEAKEIVKKMVSSVSETRDLKIDLEQKLEDIVKKLFECTTLEDAVRYIRSISLSQVKNIDSTLPREFVEDMIIGSFVDYKTTSKYQNCSQGEPGSEPYKVAHNFLLAHAAAVDSYRKNFQKIQGGKIGMTNNANWYLPYQEEDKGDQKAAERALDFMLGWFVAPLVTGKYPKSMKKRVGDRLPRFTKKEKEMVKGSYDFLGINYYTTYYALSLPSNPHKLQHYDLDQELFSTPTRDGCPIGPRAGSNWLYIYPKGIYDLLVDIKDRYDNPLVYITENGVDESTNKGHTISQGRRDPIRVKYHSDHLWYIKEAINEGAQVEAYFIWSFADNFEWDEGYTVRFGIFYVDFKNGRYNRFPKNSALWWMNFLDKKELVEVEVEEEGEEEDEGPLFEESGGGVEIEDEEGMEKEEMLLTTEDEEEEYRDEEEEEIILTTEDDEEEEVEEEIEKEVEEDEEENKN